MLSFYGCSLNVGLAVNERTGCPFVVYPRGSLCPLRSFPCICRLPQATPSNSTPGQTSARSCLHQHVWHTLPPARACAFARRQHLTQRLPARESPASTASLHSSRSGRDGSRASPCAATSPGGRVPPFRGSSLEHSPGPSRAPAQRTGRCTPCRRNGRLHASSCLPVSALWRQKYNSDRAGDVRCRQLHTAWNGGQWSM